MCQFDVTSVCTNIVRSGNSSVLNKDSRYVTYRRKQIGVHCKRRLEFLKVVDGTNVFKISNSFFYTQKEAFFVLKHSSSPVKASSFNSLSPDLLTLYRRPPRCIRAQHTTCGERGHPPTIFQLVEKLIPLTTTSQSGPDQSPLYFRLTYALPDQGPLIADPSIFSERERARVDRVSGVNGPLHIEENKKTKILVFNAREGWNF